MQKYTAQYNAYPNSCCGGQTMAPHVK